MEGEEKKGAPGLFIRKMDKDQCENQGVKSGEWHSCRLDFWDDINKRNLFIRFYRDDVMMIRCCIHRMTSRRFNKVYEEDVMAVYGKQGKMFMGLS